MTVHHLIFSSFLLVLVTAENKVPGFVIDPTDDKRMVNNCTKVNYREYCEKIGACEQGTHIMCMYYRTAQVMGPYCAGGRMIKLPAETKKYVMDLLNEMRTSVSNGNITGHNGLLPKAKKELVKLQWDKDLALFAQVWANQCELFAEDTCRATKQFSSPGQAVTLINFYYSPTAEEASKRCISHTILNEAIDLGIKRWYNDRNYVTPDTIQKYGGIEKIDGEYRRNDFLTIVNGKSTHVGCGMSAYNSYNWDESKQRHDTIAIELVCNLSAQPVVGEPIYETGSNDDKGVTNTTETTENSTGITTDSTTNDTEDVTTDLTTEPSTDTTTDSTKPTTEPSTDTTTDSTKPTTEPSTDTTTDSTKPTTDHTSDTTHPTTNSSTDQTTKHVTTPTAKPDDTTSYPNTNQTSSDPEYNNFPQGYAYANATGRRIPVIILPIVTVDDAPSEKYMQKMRLINEKLRDYSKKVLLSRNRIHNPNKLTIQKPRPPKKGSIFTRVPKFRLPSQNYDINYNEKTQESVLLKNKLKDLLKQVPRKDISRLEGALRLLEKTRSRRLNQIGTTITPLLRLNFNNEINLTNTIVPKNQNLDLNRLNNDMLNKRIDETDIDLLNVVKSVIQDHGKETRFIYGDKINNPENNVWSVHSNVAENSIRNVENVNNWNANTVFGKLKGGQRGVVVQSAFNVPVIRKQIPLVHAKENNVFNKNDGKIQMAAYSNLHRNGNLLNSNIKNSNIGVKTAKNVAANNIASDDAKLKRRMYLENEINKLKRKLLHLRQYIRQNDISQNDRFRPVVETHKNRRNIKLQEKDADNFYMPDRAYSILEF